VKKKILYLMHVPWGWIKQRPHFLAEELSDYYDVTAMCQKPFKRKGLLKNTIDKNLKIKHFYCIPFKRKFKLLNIMNSRIVEFQFKCTKCIYNSDIIWITHPEMFNYIKNSIYSLLIYDCMDDILEFPMVKNNVNISNELFILEKNLCEKSKIIFCSSYYLKNKLIKRYLLDRSKIIVVNNGVNLKNLSIVKQLPDPAMKHFKTKNKKVVYIGTISEWFDFDLIVESLDKIDNVDYLLFGPTEVSIPKHKNIIYGGSITHDTVSSVMAMADVLIMPFKVNELIKGVNPVKAYEYIYSNKPSLIVKYGETKKFEDFLFLYDSTKDYINKLLQILNNEISLNINYEKAEKFIKESEWAFKAKQIQNIMSDINA